MRGLNFLLKRKSQVHDHEKGWVIQYGQKFTAVEVNRLDEQKCRVDIIMDVDRKWVGDAHRANSQSLQ